MSSAYVSANDENGERILHTAPSSPLPRAPVLPPKQGLCRSYKPCAMRGREYIVITAPILVQIVGPPAVPCPGPPPQTVAF